MLFLHERARAGGPKDRVALNLSNLQATPFDKLGQVLTLAHARQLYEHLYKGPGQGEDALAAFQGDGVAVWAPSDNDALSRVAAVFSSYALRADAECYLKLVVAHDFYPGCSTPEDVLDLWWNGLLSVKWKSVLRQVEFSAPTNPLRFFRQLRPFVPFKVHRDLYFVDGRRHYPHGNDAMATDAAQFRHRARNSCRLRGRGGAPYPQSAPIEPAPGYHQEGRPSSKRG